MIRKAKLEDIKELLDLFVQLSPLSEEEEKTDKEILEKILKKAIEDENHHLYVYESDNKVIGTGMLLTQINLSHGGKPSGHIENVVVDKEYRKKGIGKEITNYLIEKAKEKKCYKIVLSSKKENAPFYENCGMKESGEVEMRLDIKC